jgi:hypothetical protein
MFITPDYLHEPLYVITPIFNPIRYKSRWKHYQRFAAMVKAAGGVLVTVEASFGDRHHALDFGEDQHEQPIHGNAPTKATEFHKARSLNPHQYVKVRTESELWIKENLINIGISRLPSDWKYVAWIDADIAFARPNWVGETIHQLQHYKIVQMFSEAQDLDPSYHPIGHHLSFMHCYLADMEPEEDGYYYEGRKGKPYLWHPGFAWAARRDAIDSLGGLIDWAILGAGDKHMASALIGQGMISCHSKIHPAYKRLLREWEWRAETHIRRNVGVVEGLITHYWHGKKRDRKYKDRWKILVHNPYNPDIDIKKDWQGVWQLVDRLEPRSLTLRDDLRDYFRSRHEDSIDV